MAQSQLPNTFQLPSHNLSSEDPNSQFHCPSSRNAPPVSQPLVHPLEGDLPNILTHRQTSGNTLSRTLACGGSSFELSLGLASPQRAPYAWHAKRCLGLTPKDPTEKGLPWALGWAQTATDICSQQEEGCTPEPLGAAVSWAGAEDTAGPSWGGKAIMWGLSGNKEAMALCQPGLHHGWAQAFPFKQDSYQIDQIATNF